MGARFVLFLCTGLSLAACTRSTDRGSGGSEEVDPPGDDDDTSDGVPGLLPEFAISWPEDNGYIPEDVPASSLVFGEVILGTESTIVIRTSNPGAADLDICEIYLAEAVFDENGDLASEIQLSDTHPELSTTAPVGSGVLRNGGTLDFELRFAPVYGDPLSSSLRLVVKHELNWDCTQGAGDGLYIPIFGEVYGDPVPDIYATPESIEFDELEVGQSSGLIQVTVGNAGPGTLHTADVTLGGDAAQFTLTGANVENGSLEIGEVAILEVEYVPSSQGNHSAEILISSNDPDEDPLVIPLWGTVTGTPVGEGPVAVCAADVVSAPLMTETLDGSGSYDPDNLPLSYSWVMTPPAGSAAILSSYTSTTPNITLDIAGTYSGELTVSNTSNQSDSCTQSIEAIPGTQLSIEIFWSQPDDMDLHLLQANDGSGNAGEPRTDGDCYYNNCVPGGWSPTPDWGVSGVTTDNPSLDLDDINGTGPELINLEAPAQSPYDGWYIVFVHDYPGTVDGYTQTDVTMNIYISGVLGQTYTFGMATEDEDYYVAKIHWPSGQIEACNGIATSPTAGCPP